MTKEQTPRRTQAERTRASKEKIIQAATQFFAQQGYRGAKMSDIARAANLTEPGLLHHFPSKNHLLMEVLAERDRVDGELIDFKGYSEKKDFLSSQQKLVEHNSTVPGLVQLFTTLAVESIQEEHPGHNFFRERYHKGRSDEIEMLRHAQESGEIRSDIPAEDLAAMLYAMMDGLQIQWLYEPETIDMVKVFSNFTKLLKPEND
jgi:AcrR family transcriptional regulator